MGFFNNLLGLRIFCLVGFFNDLFGCFASVASLARKGGAQSSAQPLAPISHGEKQGARPRNVLLLSHSWWRSTARLA